MKPRLFDGEHLTRELMPKGQKAAAMKPRLFDGEHG